jgi:hypothetical protein
VIALLRPHGARTGVPNKQIRRMRRGNYVYMFIAQHMHGFGEQLQHCDVLSCSRLHGSLSSAAYLMPCCTCDVLVLQEHAGTVASELPNALRRDRCFGLFLRLRFKPN